MPNNTEDWSQYEIKSTATPQTDEWSQYEVKKKEEHVSFGGSESLASPSVATEDKAVSDGVQLSFSGQQQTKTPDFMGMMDGGYKDQPSGVMKSISEGLSKAEKPLEDKYAAYVDKKRTELTGGLKLPNPMEAVDPNQYQRDLDNYTRVLRENPMAEKEDNKITAIGMLINQTKDADRVIEDYSQQNVAEKVGSGIKKGFEDYGRGYFELFDRLKQNQAVKELNVKLEDLDKGKDVTLDEGDRLLAQSLVENGNKIKQLEAISPSAYNIGKMAGESLGFTGEFLLTGGLGAGLAKSITKGVATKVAEGAAVSAAKRIGVGLSAKMAQTGIQVAAMPTFYKGIAEDVSRGENFGESLFKNYYKTFAENFTERIFLKTPWDKATVGSVDKLFGRLGVNMHAEKGVVGILASTAEEAAEEKIGEIMTAPLDNNNFKEFWNNYWDVKKNGELLGSVALMTVPMGLVSYSAKKYDDVKLDRIGKLLPSGIRSELDVVLNDKKLTLKEQYDLVGKIVEDNAANKTLGVNLGESASNIIRYVQQKTKQNVVSAVEDRAKVPTIGTKEEITTEDQARLDYLETNGIQVPDGTTMEQLNVLHDETKQKEEPKAPVVSEANPEVVEQKQEPVVVEPTISEEEDLRIKELGRSVEEDQSKYVNKISANKFEATNPFTDEKVTFGRKEEAAQYVFDLATKARTKLGRIELQQKQPLVGEQIEVKQVKKEQDEKSIGKGGEETIQGRQENVLVEAKKKLEREVKKEENKARLGRIFDNAAKLTGARLDITSEEKKAIRKELARDVVDYVKTEFDLLGEALVEKVKSFVKDNSIPLEDISDQELNDVLKEQGYAEGIRSQDKGNAEAQEGVVKGAERKVSVGNDGKDKKTPRSKTEVITPSASTLHKPRKSETTKIGNFAVRVTLDESKVPQPVKDFFKENEVGKYESISHDQAEGLANGIAAAHTYEELKTIVLEGKIHQTVRGALLVNIADIQDAEFQKAKKEGNENAMEFWADESRNFLKEINDKVHDTALFLNYFGSARMMDRFEPYHHVREAQQSIEEEREEAQNGIGGKIHKKSRDRAVKAAKKLRADAVDGAINSPKAQAVIKENETKEPVFVKPDRLKELKIKEKSLIEKLKKAMRGGTLSSGGLNTEALEALGELAVVYMEEVGYVTAKAVKKLINAAKQAGIAITEDQASKLMPTEIDGKKVSDLQAEEAKQQAAEKLAQRVFGEVISNDKTEDPLKQMVNTLLGKFKERDVKKEKKELKTDIQKIADAITNKDEYADVWAEANALAIESINENEKLTKEQKQEAIDRVNEAYQKATNFTFTEAQIDRAIKKKMASLKIRVDQVVRDFYDLQSTERGRLKDALIQETGLSEDQATKLSNAIEERFDMMMNEGKKKIIEKYIGKVKEKQDKIGQLDTKARKDAIAEFLELINIGAFDSKAFREAYATAVGLPVFTQAHADLIRSMAEEIKRQKTPEMKHKATQLLMATRQAMAGFSMSDVAQAAWYGNVLGNIKTQERNILGAWAGVAVNLGAEAAITGRPGAVIRGYAKSLKEAAAKAKDVMKTGYSPFAKTIDIPNTTEILRGRGAFKYLLAYWRNVGRFMNSADLFNATTGKATFAELLANEQIVINGVKGASRVKMLFSSKYRKQVAELVDRYLKVDKETVDRIKAEIEQDALEYGYTEQDKSLILYGTIDRLRPTEVSEEAIKFGIFATGNVKAYGTLGFLSDMLAKIFKNVIKIPVWYNKKTGKITWIAPLSFIAAFTKIAGNVGTMSMNYVPGIGAYRILVGGYGAQFNLAEGKVMGLQKYAVELTEREKKSIWGRQIAGLASMTLLWLLSDPGDDDDPFIRVTANGTGDYTENNAIRGEEWQDYSIGFKAPWGGRIWFSYKYTPLLLPFSMIGSARDAKKYIESEKEKSDMDLLLSGAWKAKSALADMTAVKSMNDFMTEFFSSKDADYNKMVKTMERTLSGFYTPGIYRDAVDAIETISSISKAEEEGLKVKDPMKGVPEMNAKLMMERFAGNNPISVIKRISEGGEYMDRRDVYGRKVNKIMPYSDVIKVNTESSEEDKMIFKHQSIMGNPSDPQVKQTFFIIDNPDGSLTKMFLNQADPMQDKLWHKYIIVRGRAIVEAIKENNYLDEEEYKETMKTAIEDATEQAKYEISYELNSNRPEKIKEWQLAKKQPE